MFFEMQPSETIFPQLFPTIAIVGANDRPAYPIPINLLPVYCPVPTPQADPPECDSPSGPACQYSHSLHTY